MRQALDADVIVVGGGISGLACAWNLQQRAIRVLLLESAAQPGGSIGTTREQGCLLESGPNSALDTTPLIAQLLDEVGVAGERISANTAARNRYILRDGRLTALPLSPLEFLGTSLFSARAKLRLACEPFIARGAPGGEESVAAFVRRRIGIEFLDYAINPFVAGVYAGDPEALSVSAAFPRLHALEQAHGSLIRGYVAGARARARDPEKSKQAAPMFAFRDGMQTLTDALARRLAQVELATEAVGVAPGRGCQSVTARSMNAQRELRARAVVLATPAHAAAKLVSAFSSDTGAALAAIQYPPVAVAISAYPREAVRHALDGFGVLVPQRERRSILGTIFSSTLFENRAPRGLALLTTFVGGMRQPELARLNDDEIAAIVQAEHVALLGAPARAQFVRVRHWERAIPQYTLGHAARMAAIETAERRFPGVFFCANYRGGVAIGDCIKSADRVAGEVAKFLRDQQGAKIPG
ncbi:MAG: protoporphyrinogen oxidase [Betaproteobacteria bacterium]|nr:protoporphyrinogen oxidase [Betaproteobacteria bacterium]